MRAASILVVIALSVDSATSQDASGEYAKAFSELAKISAKEYSITAGGDPLTLDGDSVLNWTNPAVGEIYGGVFIWTSEGRPKLVGSFYKWYRPYTHMSHEFQSLSTQPIVAKLQGKTVWETSEPGLQWTPVAAVGDATIPPPSKSPTKRLVQLRSMAKRFAVEMTEKDDSKIQLRLLSQPLMRYQAASGDVIDGAVFSFAKGTDPETLLILEARREADQPRWFAAFARLNVLAMRASHNHQTVWEVARLKRGDAYGHRGPYTKFEFAESEQSRWTNSDASEASPR